MLKTIPFAIGASVIVGVTEGASAMIEKQSIGIPAACGIFVAVVLSGKWLAGRFQDIAVSDASVKAHLEEVESRVKHHLALTESRVNDQLNAIQKALEKLPCPGKEQKKTHCKGDDTE